MVIIITHGICSCARSELSQRREQSEKHLIETESIYQHMSKSSKIRYKEIAESIEINIKILKEKVNFLHSLDRILFKFILKNKEITQTKEDIIDVFKKENCKKGLFDKQYRKHIYKVENFHRYVQTSLSKINLHFGLSKTNTGLSQMQYLDQLLQKTLNNISLKQQELSQSKKDLGNNILKWMVSISKK
ncbi:hypothetical protein AB837_00553 [bacterium AB1]|nr:hypothetical protein AB837_00553 [bacterium AB1]